ncbi:MAG: FMN-binding protein [Lachnospiraceae bacterium]|nr:FMN-binding protein [Lachnospiraceae bacterium]
MNKKIVHDAMILTAFTLVLGFVLGLVYGITKDPIAAADKAKSQAAYQTVFADAESFEAYGEFDKEAALSVMEKGGFSDEITDVQVAMDGGGSTLGYVITVIAKDASQANITFSVGIANDGTVNGYSITNISETPGLGMKVNEEAFYSQFAGKLVDSFTIVKNPPASDSEVESVSGATISSKAMANGVNACITYFHNVLEGGAN